MKCVGVVSDTAVVSHTNASVAVDATVSQGDASVSSQPHHEEQFANEASQAAFPSDAHARVVAQRAMLKTAFAMLDENAARSCIVLLTCSLPTSHGRIRRSVQHERQ